MNLALGFGLQKVAIGALLNPFGADYFQEGTQFANGKISIQFDDGYADNVTAGLPIFIEKNIPVTFYITGNGLGVDPNMMTWAQAKTAHDSGLVDVQCHTWSYGDMRLTTDEQIATDLLRLNTEYLAHGIPAPSQLAVPGGYKDDRVLNVVDDYRLTSRNGGYVASFIDRKTDKLNLPGMNIVASKVTIKAAMDQAMVDKTCLSLFGHRIGGATTGGLFVTVADLTELIDYGKSIGIEFVKMSDLYDDMLYINLMLTRTGAADTIDITCKNRLDATKDSISIERSDNDGATFSEIHVLSPGEVNYVDTGLTLNKRYYYRARGFRGATFLPYSRIGSETTQIAFTLEASGTGAGVAKITLLTREIITMTIDGNGHFYTDAAGTLGESQSVFADANVDKTIYIKVTSGTSNFKFLKGAFTQLKEWTSPTNAPTLGGDIKPFIYLEYVYCVGKNTISGDISLLVNLSNLDIAGSNTLSGSVTAMTKMLYFKVLSTANTLTGDLTNALLINYIINSSSLNSITVNVTNLTHLTYIYLIANNNNVSGSISLLTNLTYLYCRGISTLNGNLGLMSSKLTYVYIYPCNMNDYTGGANWNKLDASSNLWIYPNVGYGYTISMITQMVIDVQTTKVSGRAVNIRLLGSCASMADTNQGGIWGDYSGTPAPSALATSYKAINVDAGTCILNGITKPAATGDGAGFPAGFGNWFRS